MGEKGIGRIRERFVQRQPRCLGTNKMFAHFCILRLAEGCVHESLVDFCRPFVKQHRQPSSGRIPLREDSAQPTKSRR